MKFGKNFISKFWNLAVQKKIKSTLGEMLNVEDNHPL